MNIENIKADIELLRKITDDWNREIPEMEKEIVLSLLRRLYTDIKYTDAAPVTATPEVPEAAPVPEVKEAEAAPVQEASEEKAAPAPEPQKEEAPKQEKPEPQPEEVPQQEPKEEVQPQVEEPKEEEPQPEAEPVITRHVARNIIRSLYSEQAEVKIPEKRAAAESVADTPAAAPRTQTKVLGEVINQGPTLSDTLQMNSGRDMAEKIASADTRTLRGAIGLNDRFLMIRDLFGGDAGGFDAALSKLERFDNLEEALLYINDNFDWDPECEGARMMVELLVRKLS